MKKKVFISYSHEDMEAVKQFAFQLSLRDVDFWMDEKNLAFGGNYTTAILQGIHESDFYVVFISQNSITSNWVNAELDFALREKIERKKLTIVPIRLDDTEMPVPISNLDHIDARFSVAFAANELADKCGTVSLMQSGDFTGHLSVSSISFEIADTTDVEIGPFNEGITASDLDESRKQLQNALRKRAHGILMNFVSIEDFDFQSDVPKFKNGIYEENIEKISGSTCGSICNRVHVEATVFNPDKMRVERLLSERLDVLSVNAISFGFSASVKEGDMLINLGKKCLSKIQNRYIILSYDNREGARVEIDKDFYLSFMLFEKMVKIKLSAKYDWQFEKKMKNFSIIDFVNDLITK